MYKSWFNVLFMLVIALIIRSYIDIALWQKIFEADICRVFWDIGETCKYVGANPGQYHYGLYIIDFGLAFMGFLGLTIGKQFSNGIIYVISFYHLLISGAADILYYWLDGKAVPEKMAWLWFDAPFTSNQLTGEALFINVVYNMTLLFIIFTFLSMIKRKINDK